MEERFLYLYAFKLLQTEIIFNREAIQTLAELSK